MSVSQYASKLCMATAFSHVQTLELVSEGDFCFTGTPCTEEMGYPETDDATDDDGQGQACVPFQVTITADAWPNEISWVVNNTETEELVAKGGNDELVSGEVYNYPVECINYRKGCYEVSQEGHS